MITLILLILIILLFVGPYTGWPYFGGRPAAFGLVQVLLLVILIIVILQLVRVL